jgi:hypothetical protein
VDSRLLRPRDRLRDPRRGAPELARGIGEGQAEVCHAVHGQGGPHGGDAVAPAPHLQLGQADLGLAAGSGDGVAFVNFRSVVRSFEPALFANTTRESCGNDYLCRLSQDR